MDDFIREYLKKMRISGKDALFPREVWKGAKRLAVTYGVMYGALEELKNPTPTQPHL